MYILLIISIAAASFNSILLHKAKLNRPGAVFHFNLLASIVWGILIFIINKGQFTINKQILFWGILYGVVQTLFIFFKTAAMTSGPVSITTLIGNCSLLLSILASLLFWNEHIRPFQIFGIILFTIAIFLCTYRKTKTLYTTKWILYTILFFLSAASVGIVFKAFSKTEIVGHSNDMMLISALVMIICYTSLCLFLRYTASKETTSEIQYTMSKIPFPVLALFSGVLSYTYNRLNIYLSGAMDAVIFFPCFNGGVVILSTILSLIIFKEILTTNQTLGLLLGIISICILGIF